MSPADKKPLMIAFYQPKKTGNLNLILAHTGEKSKKLSFLEFFNVVISKIRRKKAKERKLF